METPTVNLTELTNVTVDTSMKLFMGAVHVEKDNHMETVLQYFAAEGLAEAEEYSLKGALKICPVDQGYSNHDPRVMEIPTGFILAVLAGKITKGIG